MFQPRSFQSVGSATAWSNGFAARAKSSCREPTRPGTPPPEGAGDSELAPFWERCGSALASRREDRGRPRRPRVGLGRQQLWFVQARPIATEEARLAARAPTRHWTRGLTLERFPEPLTPMGWSVLQDAFAVNLKTLDRRFGVVAKRPSDMAVSRARHRLFGSQVLRLSFGSEYSLVQVPQSVFVGAVERPGCVGSFCGRALSGRGGALSGALFKLDLVQACLGTEARSIETDWSHHRDDNLGRLEKFRPTLAALWDANSRGRCPGADGCADRDQLGLHGAGSRGLSDQGRASIKRSSPLCHALGWDEAAFADLFRSFEGNRTLEMNAEWNDCVEALTRDPRREEFLAAAGDSRRTAPEQALGRARAPGLVDFPRAQRAFDYELGHRDSELGRGSGAAGAAASRGDGRGRLRAQDESSRIRDREARAAFRVLRKCLSAGARARIQSAMDAPRKFHADRRRAPLPERVAARAFARADSRRAAHAWYARACLKRPKTRFS